MNTSASFVVPRHLRTGSVLGRIALYGFVGLITVGAVILALKMRM